MPVGSCRLEGVFQAFLAMAGATPSPDVPAFSRTGIDDPMRKFVIAVVTVCKGRHKRNFVVGRPGFRSQPKKDDRLVGANVRSTA
jgi:hypothetical protein